MLQADWMRGYPLRLWLPDRQGMPLLGSLHASPEFALAASWLLCAAHLLAVPALLWRRTRVAFLAMLACVWFWVQQSFELGVLPWLWMASSTIFLNPAWPRRFFRWPAEVPCDLPSRGGFTPATCAGAALVTAWLLAQALVPVRGWLVEGPSGWSAFEGPLAWRVLTESKVGVVQIFVEDATTGERRELDRDDDLSDRQRRYVATNPTVLRRYSRGVATREEASTGSRPRVFAVGVASLNGRQPQRLVDPEVDLASAPAPGLRGAPWILPLETPLDDQWASGARVPGPLDEIVVPLERED